MTKELPPGLVKSTQTKTFTEKTIPAKLTTLHDTSVGVWGKLVVSSGELDYVIPGPPYLRQRVGAGQYAIIEPAVPHHVSLLGPVECRVEFYRDPDRDSQDK